MQEMCKYAQPSRSPLTLSLLSLVLVRAVENCATDASAGRCPALLQRQVYKQGSQAGYITNLSSSSNGADVHTLDLGNATALKANFDEIDLDANGALDSYEFAKMFKRKHIENGGKSMPALDETVLRLADENEDGVLQWSEYVTVMQRASHVMNSTSLAQGSRHNQSSLDLSLKKKDCSGCGCYSYDAPRDGKCGDENMGGSTCGKKCCGYQFSYCKANCIWIVLFGPPGNQKGAFQCMVKCGAERGCKCNSVDTSNHRRPVCASKGIGQPIFVLND